jgi:hypothetical protein
MFDYKDDVLSFNNFVDRIYPVEPEIKDTTDTEALVHIIFCWDGPVYILPYDPQCHELFAIYYLEKVEALVVLFSLYGFL